LIAIIFIAPIPYEAIGVQSFCCNCKNITTTDTIQTLHIGRIAASTKMADSQVRSGEKREQKRILAWQKEKRCILPTT
jgi:hypothetical protein